MVVTISGGGTSGNPNHQEELLTLMSSLNELIQALSSTREVHYGTSPPDGTIQEGDLWYNPEEPRYYVYIEG